MKFKKGDEVIITNHIYSGSLSKDILIKKGTVGKIIYRETNYTSIMYKVAFEPPKGVNRHRATIWVGEEELILNTQASKLLYTEEL